jgi:hypothetical protein
MRNKSSLMIIASMVLFLLGWSVGEASTWYVSKTGNDANNGNSLATAKLTIQAMINTGSVVNGDVIEIGSGTFIEQVVISSKSITLRGRGKDNTIIQAPAWTSMTTYDEATLLFWNTTNIANSLLTSEFKPVIYVDASSNSYTVNIYGITVDGHTEAPAAPGQNFVGVMFKNAQGTIGNSLDTGKVWVTNVKGASGTTENTRFGFGIMCIGTANPLIQYNTFSGYQNAAVASIGRSLSSTLTAQMPNPVVSDCNITGVTQNNTTWYTGLMSAYGGKMTARRSIVRSHKNTGGGFVASGVLIFDGRDALIGSNSSKTDGNNITDNNWGLNVIVTNSIIGTPSLYTIKNNNIAYNGNGNSGKTCSGAVTTTGCVRYENTTSNADRTLSIASNAWGNDDPLNNGYGMSTGSPVAAGSSADAFWSVTPGDKMNVTSPLFASIENVDVSYTSLTVGWGYSAFATIQQAVDAAGDPSTVLVAGSHTYTENVCVFNKNNVKIIGDSSATCGSGAKPMLDPSTGNAIHIFSLAGGTGRTTNITVNGFYLKQTGSQRVGLLVTGTNAANVDATNLPPTGIQVRNTCFEGYATQGANGTVVASAAMSSQEYTGGGLLNGTARHSFGGTPGTVPPATPDATDIDASANNNLNYNGTSTDPTFKVWDKTDRNVVDGAANYFDARIIQTNIIIVYCGDDLNTALAGLGAGPVTVYLQGDCIYKSAAQLTISGVFDIRVDYTGRQQYPPLVVEANAGGIKYANTAAGTTWATDCQVAGKPGIRFVTNATMLPLAGSLTNGHYPSGIIANASATYMKTLAPVNYNAGAGQYQTTNYGWNRPTDLTVVGNNNGALTDAISHIADSNGFGGTVNLGNGSSFTANVDLQKRIRFAVAGGGISQTSGWIRLRNKVKPFGPDCSTTAGVGALDDVLDTRVTSGVFYSLDVRVGTPTSVAAIERADNTDTTNTIQQGLTLTKFGGTCTVNNYGDYFTGTAQTPEINRTQVLLTSDDATKFVQLETGFITLNGSGFGATKSTIRRFSVPTVKVQTNADDIQAALGTAGSQRDEGVGLDNNPGNNPGNVLDIAIPGGGANNRPGTIIFNYGGALAGTQPSPIVVEKDVRFTGNVGTPNTHSASLTMRLGAQGTQIAGSTNFCNQTVNVTQVAGSGYLQIPDIQDGLLLACSGATVNVGSPAASTTWGGATDTYNRDNTINRSVTIQGTNTTNLCANATAYVIDAAAGAWGVNAGRTNTSTFTTFTAANPIFNIASGVSTVTIQGFDFTSIANGAAAAIIYAPGTGASVSNSVNIVGNVYTGSSEAFIKTDASGTAATYHATWNIDCNRMVPGGISMLTNNAVELTDHTGTTYNRNLYDGTGSSNTNFPVMFRGLGGGSANNITRNVFLGGNSGSALWVGNLGATNAVGNVTITQNRMRLSVANGISLQSPENFVNTVAVTNNFIENNLSGVNLVAAAPITHQLISINNNSITNNTTGLTYTQTGATACGINARGNWWNNASGPTNTYNPLNVVPGTASAFGDPVSNNGVYASGDPTRISYIPWWTIATDANAATDGWQEPALTNALGRVTRTNAAGAWQASYTTINAAAAAAAANDRILIMQGMPHWTPAPGPAGSSAWGAYFSEHVIGLTNVTGVEFRGVNNSEYNCSVSAVQSSITYIAGTNNITNPIPSNIGLAITPSTGTVPGNVGNGNAFEISGAGRANTIIRNLRIQGYSSTTPADPGVIPKGAGIMATQTSGLSVDGCWFEGSLAGSANGSWGIALDRAGNGTILTTNRFGINTDISSRINGIGGVSVLATDASGGAAGAGTLTIGQNAVSVLPAGVSAGLGFANGRNYISNNERAGVQIGGAGATLYAATADGGAATTVISFDSILGTRDARGTGTAPAIAAIYANGAAGSVTITNNVIGDTTVAGIGPRTLPGDNKIDILLGQSGMTLNASGTNTIRSIGQSVDGSDVTVLDSAGTRGVGLRTFFNAAALNTFSHAAILTTDATKPYDFGTAMTRSVAVPVIARTLAVGSTVTGENSTRIYRKIATPMAAIGPQTFAAGSTAFTNVIELRENAAWVFVSGGITANQYYAENLTLPSTTGIQNFVLLGPRPTNGLNNTSAHIISATGPGTGTAITASGAENKYIRGGIVLHAIDGVSGASPTGSGFYGSIPQGGANKGDVYFQMDAIGADAGKVQFAYAATFGGQALVTGVTAESGVTPNSTANKPSIIKAGLDDANDDAYTVAASAQSRRTGVFLSGTGTAFAKPTEPIVGLGTDGLNAYPNPATGGDVTVAFQVSNDTYVRIALYDALGRKVSELKSGNVKADVYTTSFNVENLPSGAYTVRMEYDYFTKTVPVLIVK